VHRPLATRSDSAPAGGPRCFHGSALMLCAPFQALGHGLESPSVNDAIYAICRPSPYQDSHGHNSPQHWSLQCLHLSPPHPMPPPPARKRHLGSAVTRTPIRLLTAQKARVQKVWKCASTCTAAKDSHHEGLVSTRPSASSRCSCCPAPRWHASQSLKASTNTAAADAAHQTSKELATEIPDLMPEPPPPSTPPSSTAYAGPCKNMLHAQAGLTWMTGALPELCISLHHSASPSAGLAAA
jgi:hypothetical protein